MLCAKKKNWDARRLTNENKLDNKQFNQLAIKEVESRLERVKELQDRTKRFAVFWLELLVDADIIESRLTLRLSAECHELLKIFSASLATAKANR